MKSARPPLLLRDNRVPRRPGDRMAFWDFLAKLFRPETRPAAPPPPPGGPQRGYFLPINRDELLKQGEEVRRTTGWMWFGRRDIIPPVSDPRTKLIDRGMLTQGLLTAEELAEMHTIGEEWSKHANRLEHIQVQAG